MKKKRQSGSGLAQMLRQHGVKFVLGAVATGSFAFAFGEEKIQQFVSVGKGSSSSCLTQFYNKVPPYLVRESLNKDSNPLCFNGFNVMYSGVSKTPLWVAEALTPERLSQKIPREDSFHEEERVKAAHRATLADYRGSGYDRGHMAPNADMPTKEAQFDSFSLANMVPQAPKNNQQIWRELEEATRAIVTKQKQDVYVITGPVYTPKSSKPVELTLISEERTKCNELRAKKTEKIYQDCISKIEKGTEVLVPKYIYKAIYIPKLGVTGVYYAPNDNSLTVEIVSVCYLEERLGINLFPGMSEEQKRNTYKLPLKATSVKANSKIEYSHLDAESQCAEDVSSSQISALQKEFKGTLVTATASQTEQANSAPTESNPNHAQDALLKQLLDMVLQVILKLLK